VRLIAPDGAQMGIRPLPEALAIAKQLDLDLVEVADKANPPVCRIMDYGKYKYETAQRAKESRKKASNISVKEMKYRPKIGAGDFETKTRKVDEFLSEGHKVKVTIMFRGREMQHPELGRKILDHVAETVAHVGLVEVYPKQDGRNMVMVLGPDKKAQAAAEKRKKASDSERSAAEAGLNGDLARPPQSAGPADDHSDHDDSDQDDSDVEDSDEPPMFEQPVESPVAEQPVTHAANGDASA
jgi:translation initiation factor IF-3